jgi:hypothetical protein
MKLENARYVNEQNDNNCTNCRWFISGTPTGKGECHCYPSSVYVSPENLCSKWEAEWLK